MEEALDSKGNGDDDGTYGGHHPRGSVLQRGLLSHWRNLHRGRSLLRRRIRRRKEEFPLCCCLIWTPGWGNKELVARDNKEGIIVSALCSLLCERADGEGRLLY